MNEKELLDAFKHHPPSSPAVSSAHDATRHILLTATGQVLCLLKPNTRETALFITKMREAMMWGNASIAINQ